jgi:heme-degrading monooxygenase HmoA
MPETGKPYTSGEWRVKDGEQDPFVEEWKKFIEWARSFDGAKSFFLWQDTNDPQRFVSYGEWQDKDAVDAWRSDPGFRESLGRVAAHCEDFKPHDSTLVAAFES